MHAQQEAEGPKRNNAGHRQSVGLASYSQPESRVHAWAPIRQDWKN